MELSDLRIIVTGAGGGMGAYFAEQLALAGATVIAADCDGAALERLPEGVLRKVCDVSDPADVAALVQWSMQHAGGLNGLINNAGILRDQLVVGRNRETGTLEKFDLSRWSDVIDVNLTGAFLMVREFAYCVASAGTRPAVVVNMSSISRHGNRGQSNYVAAKAGLAANTVTWAREFAPFGIRVGTVAPGMVETPMTQGMNTKAREALVQRIPVGRIGTPPDLWLAVKFVIECEYFNGRTIDVDGGLSM